MAIIKDPARKRTPSISAPAWEVLAHLSEHPCLQDTLEGITEWWVLEQRIRYLVAETRAALGELVAGRFVLTRQGNEGAGRKRRFPEQMNLSPEINWYAIQTKPCGEETARLSIASLDVETFLPRAKQEKVVSGVIRQFIKPLFPSYLFAHFCPTHYLHLIRYCRGVCRVVGAGETPIPVDDQIISEIDARLSEEGFVQLEEKTWRSGDAVRVEKGPLRGCSGIFERELGDRRRVVILLDAIRSARVILERHCLGTDLQCC
jgi:transcriptional antiterminator RfaH